MLNVGQMPILARNRASVLPNGLLVIFCAPFVIPTAYLWLTKYDVYIMGSRE